MTILFRWRFGAVLLLALSAIPALGATLIPAGAEWRWRQGFTEASQPIAAWRAAEFDDAGFATAPAPFWFGDFMPGGTEITGMRNRYGCIFLRRTFVITNASEISALRLTAIVDDGFVAWINGSEALRVNMPGAPGSPVTIRTLANNAAEPVAFTTYTLPDPGLLLFNGTNVLAVQVFQSSLSSSDFAFDASLEAVVQETVPPRITAVDPAAESTVESLSQVTVTFSEAVTGVVAAHLLVNGIGATTVAAIDEATYTFTFPQPAYGSVTFSWRTDHAITDRAEPPNRFDAEAADARWEVTLIDRSPPAAIGITPLPGSVTRELSSISVLFDEAVAGVDASDLRVNGQPALSVTQIAASQYVFEIQPPPPGVVVVSWAEGHGITDAATPPNPFAGASWSYTLDPDAVEAAPYISEFMASNTRTLMDENRQFPDWIEIYNPAPAPVNLGGWSLTDSANNLAKWRFPSTNLAGGGFLIVFASGEDRRDAGSPLHTSFQLAAEGEYLALVRPDGVTVVSEFSPVFPPQAPDVSHGVAQIERGALLEKGPSGVYFTTPTPGAPNLGGDSAPGPIIANARHTPNTPADDEDLVVTAQVSPVFSPVASVELRYRVQFGGEVPLTMHDDGAHGDGAAGDGIFGARIPASAASAGQMLRYYIRATDADANVSRWPLFTNPTAAPEYLGTVVEPDYVASKLPIFHLFVAPNQLSRIDTESGGRASFFYDGEFYDNIYVELRGNTSAGLPKKSHRIEFNRGHELRHGGPGGRTRRSSLLAEYLDPTYLRQHLCFWFLAQIGNPAPYDYPVRVQLNGEFYQLAFHNDVLGKEQVERMGFDPTGAIYKAVGNLVPGFSSTGGFQKLEPDDDPSRADYLELAWGIHESTPTAIRRQTVFDLLDLPEVINHLAGARWCAENDDVWANMSLYRDTHGDGLWRIIPFDMNASWGQLWGGSSPLEATADFSKSHPLYGGSSTEGNFNRLYDVIVQLPETRQMLLRRERSIMDKLVLPPGTPPESLILENYVRHMTNLIAVEAKLDRAKWGFSPWAPGKTFEAGVNDLLNQFIGPRRHHWYVTHSITNTSRPIGITSAHNAGIPLSQPPDARLEFADLDFNPASGNQDEEYVALRNASSIAIDISGWKLEGGVQFVFRPGTVVPTNSVIYVSPDVRQFRGRTHGPRGGQGLFVVGPYSGQLSARGETLTLRNDRNQIVATHEFQGAPSAAQQFLRITELMFHPAPDPAAPIDAEEYEYVELRNISETFSLDLTGVRFTSGIDFQFSGSLVTSLAPGAHVLVVANLVAFKARYGDNLPVAGEYTGRLSNSGERIRLLDATNEEIMDFTYDDWHASADGGGHSMVVVNEMAAPGAWNNRSQWKPSASVNGSPGRADEPPVEPGGEPIITIEPVSLAVVPGGPILFSIGVTNTAATPIGVQVLRGSNPDSLTPAGFISTGERVAFIALSGADAAPPWTHFAFIVTNRASPQGVRSRTVEVSYLADADSDGLADAWETLHFQDTTAEADADPDGDGHSNVDEQMAGTDPLDANSHLRIEIHPGALRFLAVSNRTYTLQVASQLGEGGWERFHDVTAASSNRVIELPLIEDPAPRFYRLATPWQP